MKALQTHNLTKRFGEDVVAVRDLDLTIETGEIFGFLGPNGAGKSTTINMVLDFIRPTEGSIEVLGMDAQERSQEIRSRVGVLPEGYGFDDPLTGREYVEFAIETKGTDEDPGELLDKVGIEDAADRRARDYSKGMQQRLALGMALVGDPELLILDEPSSGLDPNGIQHMRSIIREQAEAGTTVFFSSHILSEVEAVCDRVGVMNEGELVAVDSIEGLRQGAGGHATIEIECATEPPVEPVTSIPGVASASTEDNILTAKCEQRSAKVDVVKTVDERGEVVDILSQNASLEELFNVYTGGGRDGDGESGIETEREAGQGADREPQEVTA